MGVFSSGVLLALALSIGCTKSVKQTACPSLWVTGVQGDSIRFGRENCISSEILDFQHSMVPRDYDLRREKGRFGCWELKR